MNETQQVFLVFLYLPTLLGSQSSITKRVLNCQSIVISLGFIYFFCDGAVKQNSCFHRQFSITVFQLHALLDYLGRIVCFLAKILEGCKFAICILICFLSSGSDLIGGLKCTRSWGIHLYNSFPLNSLF